MNRVFAALLGVVALAAPAVAQAPAQPFRVGYLGVDAPCAAAGMAIQKDNAASSATQRLIFIIFVSRSAPLCRRSADASRGSGAAP